MKVSEAKTKVCPFMSNQVNDGMDTIFAEQNCITSECMAWEYTKEIIEYKDLTKREQEQMSAPERLNKQLPEEEKEGFCQRLRR